MKKNVAVQIRERLCELDRAQHTEKALKTKLTGYES